MDTPITCHGRSGQVHRSWAPSKAPTPWPPFPFPAGPFHCAISEPPRSCSPELHGPPSMVPQGRQMDRLRTQVQPLDGFLGCVLLHWASLHPLSVEVAVTSTGLGDAGIHLQPQTAPSAGSS